MGAIQSSLNQLMLSGMGAAFAVSKSPVGERAVAKREATMASKAAQTLENEWNTLSKEEQIARQSEYQAARQSLYEKASDTLSKVASRPGELAEAAKLAANVKEGGIELSKDLEARRSNIALQNQIKAIEAKRGVQGAPAERRKTLEQIIQERGLQDQARPASEILRSEEDKE